MSARVERRLTRAVTVPVPNNLDGYAEGVAVLRNEAPGHARLTIATGIFGEPVVPTVWLTAEWEATEIS